MQKYVIHDVGFGVSDRYSIASHYLDGETDVHKTYTCIMESHEFDADGVEKMLGFYYAVAIDASTGEDPLCATCQADFEEAYIKALLCGNQ